MCALAGSTGTLYAWGWNAFGQLGLGGRKDVFEPKQVRSTIQGLERALKKKHILRNRYFVTRDQF